MENAADIIGWLLVIFIFGYLILHSLRRSDDPAKLAFRWILTLVLAGGAWGGFSGLPKPMIPLVAAVLGICLALVWCMPLIGFLADPLGGIIDGGDQEPEPAPVYSVAQVRRNEGRAEEAIAELRRQMEAFPLDFTATLMIATIQAEDLHDLVSAQATLEDWLAAGEHSPECSVSALRTLADWHVRFAQNPASARVIMERIIALYPDTQWSLMASQRIAKLPTREGLLEIHNRDPIKLPAGRTHIGLSPKATSEAAAFDPSALADGLVKQLEKFPLDSEAREQLAMVYAEHFGRVELAVDQVEQLIAQPNASPKQIARWLDLLATIHVQFGNDLVSAEEALRRIIELFPKLAAANIAAGRLVTLKAELKRWEKTRVIPPGSYERELGLKNHSPKESP